MASDEQHLANRAPTIAELIARAVAEVTDVAGNDEKAAERVKTDAEIAALIEGPVPDVASAVRRARQLASDVRPDELLGKDGALVALAKQAGVRLAATSGHVGAPPSDAPIEHRFAEPASESAQQMAADTGQHPEMASVAVSADVEAIDESGAQAAPEPEPVQESGAQAEDAEPAEQAHAEAQENEAQEEQAEPAEQVQAEAQAGQTQRDPGEVSDARPAEQAWNAAAAARRAEMLESEKQTQEIPASSVERSWAEPYSEDELTVHAASAQFNPPVNAPPAASEIDNGGADGRKLPAETGSSFLVSQEAESDPPDAIFEGMDDVDATEFGELATAANDGIEVETALPVAPEMDGGEGAPIALADGAPEPHDEDVHSRPTRSLAEAMEERSSRSAAVVQAADDVHSRPTVNLDAAMERRSQRLAKPDPLSQTDAEMFIDPDEIELVSDEIALVSGELPVVNDEDIDQFFAGDEEPPALRPSFSLDPDDDGASEPTHVVRKPLPPPSRPGQPAKAPPPPARGKAGQRPSQEFSESTGELTRELNASALGVDDLLASDLDRLGDLYPELPDADLSMDLDAVPMAIADDVAITPAPRVFGPPPIPDSPRPPPTPKPGSPRVPPTRPPIPTAARPNKEDFAEDEPEDPRKPKPFRRLFNKPGQE